MRSHIFQRNKATEDIFLSRITIAQTPGSQVILALCSLGIDPTKDERFIKNGGNPVSALLSFETEDGGIDTALDSSGTGKQTNVLATRQAISALTALRLLQKGNGKFFDFNNNL